MTTHFATRLMPAGNTQKFNSTEGKVRREVNTVNLFENRKAAKKRAWDRLSETDKSVLLESVRRRRQHQADKVAQIDVLHGFRSNR